VSDEEKRQNLWKVRLRACTEAIIWFRNKFNAYRVHACLAWVKVDRLLKIFDLCFVPVHFSALSNAVGDWDKAGKCPVNFCDDKLADAVLRLYSTFSSCIGRWSPYWSVDALGLFHARLSATSLVTFGASEIIRTFFVTDRMRAYKIPAQDLAASTWAAGECRS